MMNEQEYLDNSSVKVFSELMKQKLAVSRARGRSGWEDPGWPIEDISAALYEHLRKGDPIDVANYCMFIAMRGENIQFADSLPSLDELEQYKYERFLQSWRDNPDRMGQ